MTLSNHFRSRLARALSSQFASDELCDAVDNNALTADGLIDAIEASTNTQLAQIRQSLGLFNRVSVIDHGAVGDGQVLLDLTNSGTTVTGPSGSFSQADVGKTAWCTNTAGGSVISIGTISSVSGTTQAVLSGSASGSYSGVIMYFGTDDTAAIQAAWTAAKAAGKLMYFPDGLGTKYVIEINSIFPVTPTIYGSSIWTDVLVQNVRGFLSSFYIGTSYSAIVDSLFSYNGPDYGFIWNGFQGHAKNCWTSNGHTYGMSIVGGSDISFYGYLLDEHGWYTLQVLDSTARFHNSTIYGGIGAYCIELQGTGKVYLDGCKVEPYSLHVNSPAILTASGTTVYARNSTITSTGTGKCITGGGTLIDEGGNTFTGTVDVTTRKGPTFGSPPVVPSYTVATLPSVSVNTRGLIYVSDESGGATLAFSDGTNWRRVQDRAIVS